MPETREWRQQIEALGCDFRPPAPEPRKGPVGKLGLIKLFRESLIAVFSEQDYKREVISARFGLLDVHTINSPKLVREAFQTEHDALQAKTPQMRNALKTLIGDGLFVSDRETWQSRRSAVGPIIHARRVKDFLPIMLQVVEEWRASWEAMGEGAEVDMLAEMGQLTAEVISRTIFGRQLGRELTGRIVSGFAEYQERVDQLDLLSVLGAFDWVPRIQRPSVHRAAKRIHRVIDDVIDEFASGRGDGNAVINSLFSAQDANGEVLTREAIRNEALVIFMAGHETTANALSWAWYLLSQDARVRGKFADETAATDAPTNLDDVRKLIYTRSIIEETLRLYPPVPILGRQAIAATRIGDLDVRKGSVVIVSPFMLHRKDTIFSKPNHFVPERFDERVTQRPGKYEYIPFAVGPRICPGMVFGLTEAVIALSMLGRRFNAQLAPGHVVEAECRLTLRPGARLPMILRRRD